MAWIRRYGAVVVLTLLLCAGLSGLGWSRLNAAQTDKSGALGENQFDLHTDQLVQQTSMPAQVGKVAQLVGRYRPEYTLFLEGGRMYGQSGLYVYTPFELRRGDGMSILVLRDMYSTQWAAKDIKGDFFRRHWPDRFPSVVTYYRQALALFGLAALMAVALVIYLIKRRGK